MNRTFRGLATVWLFLMALLLAALAVTFIAPGRMGPGAVLATGIIMVVVVAFAFMRVRGSSGLSQAFVVAALFWLAVLLGLGSMDPLTRTDYPVAVFRPL